MVQITVWKNEKPTPYESDKLIDRAIYPELSTVKYRVLHKDRDWVGLVDGEEGVGKSVFAQQLAKFLDPNFSLDNIVFTSDDFIKKIKDPRTEKGTAIVLDEAFNSANSRASMSEVNRSLVGVATEMRQKNLFIIIVLPSFFDLDKYFALWRCRALFHVYFGGTSEEERRYIIFPKKEKKFLYLSGKKTYSYAKPRSPFPACKFPHIYTVDEIAYRKKKADAFKKRTVSNQARKWLLQRDSYIKFIFKSMGLTQEELAKIPANYGVAPMGQQHISRILREIVE